MTLFYVQTDVWLQRLWGRSTHMIHFGYYPDGNRSACSHEESLIETVRQVAIRLNLSAGMNVLDAGCGVGGATVWICRNYDVAVHGISIVPLHVRRATEYARQQGLNAEQTTFSLRDYTKTGFNDASFDAVFAIESVCYALEKMDFLNEAYRVLKPGGRLVVLDGFRTTRNTSPEDEALMHSWLAGWGATDLDTIDEFTDKAVRAGFADVKFDDMQGCFAPSHHYGQQIAKPFLPFLSALAKLHLIPNTVLDHCRAACDLWRAAEKHLLVQAAVTASKPRSI